MPKLKITFSPEETQQFAREYLEKHLAFNVLALYGDLGSGKTTFAQGLAKALGIKEPVTSPTFILLRAYLTTGPIKRFELFYHVDLYRVRDWQDVETLDLASIWNNPENLVVIEWPERIKKYLPKNRDEIYFEYTSANERKLAFPKKPN